MSYIHTYSFVFCYENKKYIHTCMHTQIFFFQINIAQTSDGTTYTGSVICPSCLEICYVRKSHYIYM